MSPRPPGELSAGEERRAKERTAAARRQAAATASIARSVQRDDNLRARVEQLEAEALTDDDRARLRSIAMNLDAGIEAGQIHPDFGWRDARFLRKLAETTSGGER
jgi:hypothetical protein